MKNLPVKAFRHINAAMNDLNRCMEQPEQAWIHIEGALRNVKETKAWMAAKIIGENMERQAKAKQERRESIVRRIMGGIDYAVNDGERTVRYRRYRNGLIEILSVERTQNNSMVPDGVYDNRTTGMREK